MIKDFSFKQIVLTAMFFAGLAFLAYGPSLRNPFMIDDYDLFLENPMTKSPQFLFHNFLPDLQKYWGIENTTSSVYYRPICHFLPMAEYLLFNNSPFPFHLINLVLLAAIGFTAFFTFRLLTRNTLLAFITAVLFCVHPINSMIVNYVSSGYLEIQTLTMLASVFFFLKVLESQGWPRYYFYGASLLSFVTAILCHETAVMLPLYIALIGFWFTKDLRRVLKLCSPYFLMLVMYFIFRFLFASIKASLFDKIYQYHDFSVFVYGATFTKLFLWYGKQILAAPGIVLIWMTPLVRDYVFLWLTGAGIVAVTAVLAIKKWGFFDIKSLAVVWFVLGIFPVLAGSMFNPSAGMMIEPHWLFFASFGLFILIAKGLLFIKDKCHVRIWFAGIAVLFVLCVGRTWQYDQLWGDELRYCRYWDSQVQGNKAAKFYMANAAMRQGRKDLAKTYFKDSLAGIRSDWQIYTNLGLIALEEGDNAAAEQYFLAANMKYKNSYVVYNNLGVLDLKKDKLSEAQRFFEQAIKLNRFSSEPKLNLAGIYEKEGKTDQALSLYQAVYDHDSRDERVMCALLRVGLIKNGPAGILAQAEEFLPRIKSEKLLVETGDMFAVKAQPDLAIEYLAQAIQLYPRNLVAYREAGKVLANAGKYSQASMVWKLGLKVAPNDEELQGLMKELEAISGGKGL